MRTASVLRTVSLVVAMALSHGRSLPAKAQSLDDSARVAGWRSDIAYYLQQLKARHYVYRSRPLPPGLVAAAAQLSRNIPRYSDERVLAEFEHLASFAGDGHTYILPFGASRVT